VAVQFKVGKVQQEEVVWHDILDKWNAEPSCQHCRKQFVLLKGNKVEQRKVRKISQRLLGQITSNRGVGLKVPLLIYQ